MIIRDDDKRMVPVLKIRAEISEHLDAIDRIDDAPLPVEDIEARLDAWLETEAGGGILDSIVPGMMRPDGHGPSVNEAWSYNSEQPFQFNLMNNMLRFHASVFPDQLKHSLMAEARRRLEARTPGLPLAERPAARKRLEAELKKFEIDEEKAIEKIEAATGGIVPRRPDADPRIILGEVRS